MSNHSGRGFKYSPWKGWWWWCYTPSGPVGKFWLHTSYQTTHAHSWWTLDHVFTRREDTIIDLRVDPAGVISDHSLITWWLKFTIIPPITSQKTIRNWKKVDRTFRQALQNSALCEDIPDGVGPDSLFETYEAVLRKLADKFAPSRKVTIRRQPIAVWYDDESRLLRRRSRTLEKRYRRSGLASDRLEWVRHERESGIGSIERKKMVTGCWL